MTTVLTVKVASMAAESYVLTRYSAEGGGQQTWPGTSMSTGEFAALVAQEAATADFVCVDEVGLGIVMIDELERRGIGVLRTHRMRRLHP